MVQPGTSSGVVRVQLIVKHQQGDCQEVIKRVTKAHEVVEVDGFVFRRKRRLSAANPTETHEDEQLNAVGAVDAPTASPKAITLGLRLSQNADHAASPSASPPPVTLPGDAHTMTLDAVQGSSGAAKLEEVQLAQDPGLAVLPLQPRRAPAPDTVFNIMPMELVYLVQWVLTAELKRRGHLSSEDVVATASRTAEHFAKQLREFQARAQNATLVGPGCAVGAEPAGAVGVAATGSGFGAVAALPYQVERLRAALREKHNKLVQEEAAWLQLEQQYQTEAQAQVSPDPLQATCPPGEQDDAATLSVLDSKDPGLPQPSHDAQSKGSAVHDVEAGPSAPGTADEGTIHEPAVHGSATAAQSEALQRMSLQVDALCSLVAKTEAVVADAEAAASALQATYHRDRFKAYPHVDSPAWLIRSILRPVEDGQHQLSP